MATPRHRVSVAVAHAHTELDTVADASVWSMSPDETTTTLVELSRLKARVAELEARVAEHADDETLDAWAHRTRQTRPAVVGQVRLGQALVARQHVRDALAAGDLVVDQARVIVRALDQLPADLGPELTERAETHLVAEAAQHTTRTLRVLGRRLIEVVAPTWPTPTKPSCWNARRPPQCWPPGWCSATTGTARCTAGSPCRRSTARR